MVLDKLLLTRILCDDRFMSNKKSKGSKSPKPKPSMVYDRPIKPIVFVGQTRTVVVLPGTTKLEADIRAAHRRTSVARRSAPLRLFVEAAKELAVRAMK